ncbi:hypothetical protein BGAL_0567g00070 [Botrytis galanthina]|uniref:Uncharacterized protein n=1 Tax=Botrytis galanthina TaxID=278940 RepID=A0A4S8QIW8_9HELO|nr:hypothetical protein BGAL_0567g00070 [Botrytis galanthina]
MSINDSPTNINVNMNPLYNAAYNQQNHQDIQALYLPYYGNNNDNSHLDPQPQCHQYYNAPTQAQTQLLTPTTFAQPSTTISYHISDPKNKITKLSQKAKLRKQASYHKKSRSKCYDVADLFSLYFGDTSFQLNYGHSSSTKLYPSNASSYPNGAVISNGNTPRELSIEEFNLVSALKSWDENVEVPVSNSALDHSPEVNQSQMEEKIGGGMSIGTDTDTDTYDTNLGSGYKLGLDTDMEGYTSGGNDDVLPTSTPIPIHNDFNLDISDSNNAEQRQASSNQVDDAFLNGLKWTDYMNTALAPPAFIDCVSSAMSELPLPEPALSELAAQYAGSEVIGPELTPSEVTNSSSESNTTECTTCKSTTPELIVSKSPLPEFTLFRSIEPESAIAELITTESIAPESIRPKLALP